MKHHNPTPTRPKSGKPATPPEIPNQSNRDPYIKSARWSHQSRCDYAIQYTPPHRTPHYRGCPRA
nr:MAG TPA: hypothetical protein [Caudoviricetes sp.]